MVDGAAHLLGGGLPSEIDVSKAAAISAERQLLERAAFGCEWIDTEERCKELSLAPGVVVEERHAGVLAHPHLNDSHGVGVPVVGLPLI